MLQFFSNLDRRWIFLLMFLSVGIPILLQLQFPEKPSKIVLDVYDAVEKLPDGSRILMAYDYDPASAGELQPMAFAFTRHCAKKNHKLFFMTLWPQGVPMVEQNIEILKKEFPAYEYGKNYVNLGFKPGNEGVIKLVTTDLKKLFFNDNAGKNLDSIPMTQDLKNVQSMDLIINVSAGNPGAKEWIQYASTPFGIETVVGCTGVTAPGLYPYVPGQLRGLLGAIKGAAEYEKAILDGYPDLNENENAKEGLRRMGPQLVAHVLMIGLIILGNIIYFAEKKQGEVG